jgi:hypothetical protein
MTEESIQSEFNKLVDIVEEKWKTTYSAEEIEPSFLNVLNFVKQNLTFRDTFVQCFISLLHNPEWKGPVELIEFCMFEFRWPEVKQAAEEIVKHTQDIRERDYLWTISTAYSDNWDGAQFYSYYSNSQNSTE